MTDPLTPRVTLHRLHAWEMCGCRARHETIERPGDVHVTAERCGCPLRHEKPNEPKRNG